MLRPKPVAAAAVVLMVAALMTGTGGAQQGLQTRTVLQTMTYWSGQAIQFPLFRNQMTGLLFEIAPGGRVGRHMHPVPVFVYILEGEGTFEGDGHVHKVYRPGEAFVDGGAWHDLLNRGTAPLRALAVFAGEEGTPLTVRPTGAAGPQGLQVRTVLQTMTYWSGQPVQFPTFRNQMTGVLFEIAPGGRVGRHMHPVPVFVYVLQGDGTFEADGHAHKVYRTGEAFVDGGAWHDLVNRGTAPLRALAVFAGEQGKPLTIRP